MNYVLTGFTQDMGFRVFAFEGVTHDHTRTVYKVRADLDLIRRYGIRVQDLPLLCRGMLEQRNEGDEQKTFTYSENDMRRIADLRAVEVEAARKKSSHRRPPPGEKVGAAWRARPV